MSSEYAELGVDVDKEGIEVFRASLNNMFPWAFCTVIQDPESEDRGIVLHTDGAGSKPVQNYLHWKESEEVEWFEGIAQDVLAMNLDDIICVGARPIAFVDYIALNKAMLSKKDILSALSSGFGKSLKSMKDYGIEIFFGGGETADLPDQLRTLDVSGTITGRVNLSDVITGREIEPDDLIVGLRSGGQAKYECNENSGIMCNGITLARHCLMKKEYERKYPEIGGPQEKGYYGKFFYDDYLDELRMTVGEAIVSPTRFFAPVVKEVLEKYGSKVVGLIHNTGGGQTKCLNLGENVHYFKNDLIEPDPVFSLVQHESGEDWRHMFQNFNMGIGFEIVIKKDYAEDILDIPEKFGVEAKIIGRCEESDGKNKVTIESEFGKFRYRA
ncbi:hypothetical protein AKJ45_01165 [candidate division MSBL1 archaeon SCGC-AAA261F19]|uniref:PurM-like N-terminal domain-containing protein n=2 Tax=candidate division MSBL1 TaxID=215777 RepID=A0A133VB09_9EURY|nr:hypothetical protein AKJ43_00150 [candidate division MSBL1 archaeon SCGC-AAA261D19]KXB03597.1 hypothetical protein AKJ45_01165 [candidate division MSBL1 archaeon SCGC-AAA261F19]